MTSPAMLGAIVPTHRSRLLARTAICGVLAGICATTAHALPVAGFSEVNPGGGLPVIVDSVARTDITLNAPRTVISWSSYNVKPDETVTYNFSSRNGIVLNKIISLQPSRIEGAIQGKVGGVSGGNIWFISQNSIIIGRGAQIDAGGLLFGIGTANTTSFLDPANNTFAFDGNDAFPGSRLWVLSNARVRANGGMVAFTGPTVVTRANASVTATEGSVLYGSAKSYTIRLAPGAGGDFDLVDFVVPDAASGGPRRGNPGERRLHCSRQQDRSRQRGDQPRRSDHGPGGQGRRR
jgi:filamentous hemagglutinin family protein